MSIFNGNPERRSHVAAAFLEYCKRNAKTYRSPDGYLPWSSFLKVFLGALKSNQNSLFTTEPIPSGAADFLTACFALSALDVPVRYVSDDMAAAWSHTKLPQLEYNRPTVLPAFVVFPPLRNCAFDMFPDEQVVAQIVMELPEGLKAVSLESRPKTAGVVEIGYSSSFFAAGDKFDHLSGLDRQAAALALNAWLVHTYEPELITVVASARQPGSGFGKRSQTLCPIPPTWIGRDFKVRRITQDQASSEPGVKLRSHWRSGHWHTVRHGKGRQEERLQWYRPVYVNASNP